MSRHGPVPAAALEGGLIPLWSEAFLVVGCPYLHLIEPGWPPLPGLTQSTSDVGQLFQVPLIRDSISFRSAHRKPGNCVLLPLTPLAASQIFSTSLSRVSLSVQSAVRESILPAGYRCHSAQKAGSRLLQNFLILTFPSSLPQSQPESQPAFT